MSLRRRLLAEALGTSFLLTVVVGSGVMGERMAAGSTAIALLANSIATGCALFGLILMFGSVSGAHLNPAVSLAQWAQGRLAAREAAGYIAAQVSGAFAGVASAHAMFGLPLFSASSHARPGLALAWSEFIATFGLLLMVLLTARKGRTGSALAIACYITSAYWFTASTSFANPAVTLARAFTDSFTGIRINDVPGFVIAQLLAVVAVLATARLLTPMRVPQLQSDANDPLPTESGSA